MTNRYYRAVDVKGRRYLYFRKKGHPQDGQRLKSAEPAPYEGSPLEAEINALLALQPAKPTTSNLAGATRSYELGADFRQLAESTRYEYRLILKEFDADFGTVPVAGFTPSFIQGLRDAWARRGHRAANMRLHLLKKVLDSQIIAADLPDPFSRIKQVRRPQDAAEPHPIWPEAVVRLVVERAIELRKYGLARAVALARYAGVRRGDLVRIGHVARENGRISWLPRKRKVPVSMPEDPLLTEWLASTPSAQPLSNWQKHVQRKTRVIQLPPTTLVYNTRNRPYTEDGLGQELAQLVAGLHAAGRIPSAAYDLHGLRHTFGVELALAGATDAQGAALMGHGSPSSFPTYRRQANRLRMSDEGAALIQAMRERALETGPERPASNDGQTVSNPPASISRLRSEKP